MHSTNSTNETMNGPKSEASISQRVVFAVADRTGVSAHELPPLYDRIDPDALNALVRSDDADLELSFSFAGYRVTVDTDGAIHVREES